MTALSPFSAEWGQLSWVSRFFNQVLPSEMWLWLQPSEKKSATTVIADFSESTGDREWGKGGDQNREKK